MLTPVRRQYLRIKKEHPDEILLFRMGDFYETFDSDAQLVSKELEIALTSREMGKGQHIPLAGIPYHALDSYLAKLIKKGHHVAICEQTSDSTTSSKLVDRKVVRVVTPGTIVEDALLEKKTNNFLASIVISGEDAGLAYVDITTSEFATTQLPFNHLSVELARLAPSEILSPANNDSVKMDKHLVTRLNADWFDLNWSSETLTNHFGVTSLEPFGCESLPLATRAAGAIVEYLSQNHKLALSQLSTLYTYSTKLYMMLDIQTRQNLELFEGGRWAKKKASLFSVLDHTQTPMGGRMLRSWLGQPLLDLATLVKRQDAVNWFYQSGMRRERITNVLKSISDIERLLNRIRSHTASPRDLVGLGRSLRSAPDLQYILKENDETYEITWLADQIGGNKMVVDIIKKAINDDPPISVSGGGVIRDEFSIDLDELRQSSSRSRGYMTNLELTEQKRTGIKSLKVRYNKNFGYFIEVTNPNLAQVPLDYIRRQTLVGGERYITPEMKEYESQILNAQDRIAALESTLFRQVCQQIADAASQILDTAMAIAQVDTFCTLGETASKYGYVRPKLTNETEITIKHGRHPVVERMLYAGDFVPNDTRLSNTNEQLIILTGPNMAGKSTYIRQVALITLMAQVGGFVPAESATIGLVDRIFTRVGLQDDLAVGQSTFMVEMLETAAIINHATPKSLVILDEIGRGTSTYDGLAIARAVAEHIHSHPSLGCKTLFATHYHELTQLGDFFPRVRNYNVAVSENRRGISFLRRIIPGGAGKSYGIHVAQLAGLPGSVTKRAWDILKELENSISDHDRLTVKDGQSLSQQLPLLKTMPEALNKLLELDIATMSPLEAITKLYELQKQAKKENQSID